MTITFARGTNTRDSNPIAHSLATFAEFREVIKRDLALEKGRQYITGVCHVAPDDQRHRSQFLFSIGKPHRCKNCVGTRRWIGLDIDGGLSPTSFVRLQEVMCEYSGMIYTTASHTPNAPRCRIVIELDQEVQRDVAQGVSRRVRMDINARMGDGNIKWDDACDRSEQPLYLPLVGADFFDFNGSPVAVGSVNIPVNPTPVIPAAQVAFTGEVDLLAAYELAIQVDKVRVAGPGKRNAVLNNAAYVLGTLVGAGRLDSGSVETTLLETVAQWGDLPKQQGKIKAGLASGKLKPRPMDPACERIWRAGNEQIHRGFSPPTASVDQEVPLRPLSSLSSLSSFAEGSNQEVIIKRGDSIIPEPIHWLWNGWLAAGKMHLIGGAPGCGKTTIACKLAATVTIGGRWPDGTLAPVGDVVIWSGEDDVENVLAPRMIASGADMSRVHFVVGMRDNGKTVSFDPSKDLPALELAFIGIADPRLLVIDPIVSTVGGDSHKNAEVRRALQPLVDLAAKFGLALLGITHFTKGTQGREPIERITGSLAFGALARVVMVAATAEASAEGADRRILVRAKSNLGPSTGGFNYALQYAELAQHRGVSGSSVHWGDALHGAARDLLGDSEAPRGADKTSCLQEAKRWLSEFLATGPVLSDVVRRAGSGAGHSFATLKRAKEELGIKATKIQHRWVWKPPPSVEHLVQGAQGDQEVASRQLAPPPLPLSQMPPLPGPLPFPAEALGLSEMRAVGKGEGGQ